jgi:hypothetical protein
MERSVGRCEVSQLCHVTHATCYVCSFVPLSIARLWWASTYVACEPIAGDSFRFGCGLVAWVGLDWVGWVLWCSSVVHFCSHVVVRPSSLSVSRIK